MTKKLLWLKIRNYNFEDLVPEHLWDKITHLFGGDNASKKAFASKIALKLGWEPDFAMKAILEYKKFVYLGVVADFSVTPPKIIDQVWHEHILFTKGYRSFCDTVIQTGFDHNPELVPAVDQTGVFNAQYLDTLDLYKREFNVDPPAEIWGAPKFNPHKVKANGYESQKKKKRKRNSNKDYHNDSNPLYYYFEPVGNDVHARGPSGFGGGDLSGGGADGSWSDDNIADSMSADTSSDSGGGGGDSDGDGGSGCSSGCGGCGGD